MTSTPHHSTSERQGRILVADDEPRNRKLLRDLLEGNGYSVVEAEDGAAALEKAGGDCDVILLDVMMPRMDGLQVCRQLKANPETAYIPVLMVTALTEKEQRRQGIDAGANDYLAKPIDLQDVLLRVRNAVYAKRLHDKVQQDLEQLRELELLRDNLIHMIVHDMRSPLFSLLGMLELALAQVVTKNESQLTADLTQALKAARRLTAMADNMLDVNRFEDGKMPLALRTANINHIAQRAVNLLAGLTEGHVVSTLPCPGDPSVRCDPDLIERVISNLLGNALKHTPPNAAITVGVAASAGTVTVSVHDTGKGIPPEYHKMIFEKFGQVQTGEDPRKHSTGLGLTFCKLAVEAHGGRIGLHSEVGKGSTFWFELPGEQVAKEGRI